MKDGDDSIVFQEFAGQLDAAYSLDLSRWILGRKDYCKEMRTKYDFDSIEKMKNPQFKVVLDDMGTEYIVWDDSPIETDIGPMGDRTAFEAVENHIHLVDGINRSEFDALCILGKELADLCLSRLKQHHPDRMFLVYVSIRLGDSMILRFHQEWDGEAHYYEKKIHTYNERLIKCRG